MKMKCLAMPSYPSHYFHYKGSYFNQLFCDHFAKNTPILTEFFYLAQIAEVVLCESLN